MTAAEAKAAAVKVKDMPSHQQPRERLLYYGPQRLTDQELLAILLRTGSKGESVMELAQRLLVQDKGRYLLDASVASLCMTKGIGVAKASNIVAAFEFSRRLLFITPDSRPTIKGPKDAADLLQSEIGFLDREAVRVINLNVANQVVAIDTVSLGGLSAAPVHPREVYKEPLKRSAASIILLHNHPSGELKPSRQDMDETRKLAAAGEILGIQLFDHVIISHGNYYSMLENGKMPYSA
ncbi:MAG: DNA repair protein RadC [Clostridiales bacterium]|nr:DNA repair protein RadC [Clostridiales bacterium]